jgi:hypothetical protein
VPNAVLLELRSQPGNVFTVLLAGTRSGTVERLNVAFIGLERSRAPEVQHLIESDIFRHSPDFRNHLGPANFKKWLLIDDYLSEIFATIVPDGEEHKYKPTIALANFLFSAPNFDAVMYPSVATADHGINVCALPDKADQLFSPLEAWMIEAGEDARHPKTGQRLQRIQFLSRSHKIGPDGLITWRRPGEGINTGEIMRFVRHRMQPLDEWPLSVKA